MNQVPRIESYGILAEIKKIYKYNDQLYKMVAVGISRVKLLSIKFDVDKIVFMLIMKY